MLKFGPILSITPFLIFGNLQAQALEDQEEGPKTLGLENGLIDSQTSLFTIKFVRDSQTIAALCPKESPDFDFTPGERLTERDTDGYYHLGDINLRLRMGSEWKSYASSRERKVVKALDVSGNILAAADLSPTFEDDIPLKIIRFWESDGGALVMRFHLENISSETVEIGALGAPMIFNNILDGKSLDEAHSENVFYDPYIGNEAGYLQVIRLHGKGPVLLVIPQGHTGFEAYNPLNDDPTQRGITFEGFHEWMVYSKAYAENEWSNARPWNQPTSIHLKPGESRDYAWKMVLAKDIKDIENTLALYNRPVAVGFPGYVLPRDVNAGLMLHYNSKVKSLVVEPKGSLEITPKSSPSDSFLYYEVKGNTWGRARLTVTYDDGLIQTIHYKVIKSESDVIRDFGHFLLTEQWYENPSDPFNRDQSVISYDYFEKQPVTEDSRAWLAGLSDEAGAGSWLGAIMKQYIQPDKSELLKLESFYRNTLWGGIQYSEGTKKYGVRKSMFYYEPEKMPAGTYNDSINYTTWAAWSQEQSESTGRSFNYPHVAAAHWVMYRLSRYHYGLVEDHPWKWYLENAYHTAVTMVDQASHYAQFGQMEGTVFVLILKDLQREGMDELADSLMKVMKKRAELWSTLNYPFGSEMPWDSTGQEEVFMWSDYFGLDSMAAVTLNAILAYMPTIPHWGYNGSARRYWDFVFGGKLQRIERQLHHYGSGMNAIPVLKSYRENPTDLYLLRVGYGGLMGTISNITEDGFGPAAFHSYPSTLKVDGYSGDYGSGFFGYAINSSSYLYHNDTFGWVGFGGNVIKKEQNITINITTAAASRVYIAPAGLWLTLDAGQFESVTYNSITGSVSLTLRPFDKYTPNAYLRIEQPASVDGVGAYSPVKKFNIRSNAYVIELSKKSITLRLTQH